MFVQSANAQIEMNSYGNVGIGSSPIGGIDLYSAEGKISKLGVNTTPSATYELKVSGQTELIDGTATSLIIEQYDGMFQMVLRPSLNNYSYVGTSSYQFNKIYGKYIYQNGSQVTSDLRLKENIRDLPNSLEKLRSIRGVKFDFKSPVESETNQAMKDEMEYLDKDRYGFIAQEIMEIFPDLVKLDEKIDQYSVDYMGIIPILVEAVKEQQGTIESLQNQINTLSAQGALKSTEGFDAGLSDLELSSKLFQNAPNPFDETTTIKYSLDEAISSAYIYLYDMSGKQIRRIELPNIGTGEVTISGGELDAGMYMYSLVADGDLIGTKQMLLTD